ncbi:hypothetical protein [Deinococcus roseus]|uniref:Uncharacterized protein n=1 Tax=Deinococcus roseus TaxID=392414 RepID=A0ABQ2DDD7_9DEIO|nr:hypothetical protein [Deinococcus roseus]GGJ51925.1 hypothetical protein GCM10008938_42450 [Deinococcus roseus]
MKSKNTLRAVTLLVLSLSPALAQQAQTGNQTQGQNSQMRAEMDKIRPILDLSREIRQLGNLHKQKGLAISKAQAAKLIPILKDLQTRKSLTATQADSILVKIEDTILSDKQLTWLDSQGFGPGGQNGQAGSNGQNVQNRPNGQNDTPPSGQQGTPPQGGPNGTPLQGGPRGNMSAITKAANAFTVDPFKTELKTVLTLLQGIK